MRENVTGSWLAEKKTGVKPKQGYKNNRPHLVIYISTSIEKK